MFIPSPGRIVCVTLGDPADDMVLPVNRPLLITSCKSSVEVSGYLFAEPGDRQFLGDAANAPLPVFLEGLTSGDGHLRWYYPGGK